MTVRDLVADRRLVPKAFDRAARRYDLLTSMNPGYDRHLRLSAERLGAAADGRILDLCCGTGRSTAPLRDVYPRADIVGVDGSAGMLARADRSSVALVQADGARPPLRDGGFDAVLMAYGLRNMGDPDAALDAVVRVLRPGGRLALHEYALTDTRSKATWAAVAHLIIIPSGFLATGSAELYRYLYRSVMHFDRAHQLTARLRAHGFVDVERHDMDHWQKGILHTFTATRA